MGWDDSRPVPWRRLTKEWMIYAAIMAVVFAVFFRSDRNVFAILGGLLVSGPLYLGLGYVLAKFGYTRKTLGDLDTPRAGSRSSGTGTGSDVDADQAAARARPAPTRRTSTGRNRPTKGKRR
jgi:hypothetical protein